MLFMFLSLCGAISLVAYHFFSTSPWGQGIRHLQQTSPISSWVIAWSVFLLVCTSAGLNRRWERVKASYVAVFSVGMAIMFYYVRSNMLNSDGFGFAEKFGIDIPVRGAHVTHDEILELFLHSRFYFYANYFLNWSVIRSYQVLSCLAGFLFSLCLFQFCRRNVPFGLWAAVLVMSSGFMQLYFGDVENYSYVTLFLLLYWITGVEFLKNKERSLALPCFMWSVGVMFHLLAGFYGLSLLALFWEGIRRRNVRDLIFSAVVLVAVPSLVLLYFHYHGLPFSLLFSNSHAFAQGGSHARYLSIFNEGLAYYAELAVMFLILAPMTLWIPIVVKEYRRFDVLDMFMGLSVVSGLAFVTLWRAQLGILQDWNLFAHAAIPLSLWIVIRFPYERYLGSGWNIRYLVTCAMCILQVVLSVTWILFNHYGRAPL